MRKNIFCLVVDALSFPYMNDKYNAMPFLRAMQEKYGHYCKNMYSQGPYTEAALTPLYTGRDNMDFGGNFFRGQQASKTVFEAFSDNGFDVISYTQPLIYPKPMHRGINNERYGVCYFFSAVWDYRLSHFAELYRNNELIDSDYVRIIELIDSNFKFWLDYLTACKNNDMQADFVNLYTDTKFDFDMAIAQVDRQYNLFMQNKKLYVENLLKNGRKHELFKIPNYSMTDKSLNSEIFSRISRGGENKSLFKKICNFNKAHNKSRDYSAKALMKIFFDLLRGHISEAVNRAKVFHYHKRLRSTKKEIANMFRLRSNYKPEPTIIKYFEHFSNWYKGRNTSRPFYCMMHISDLHTPEIFFSIDSDDYDTIQQELSVMSEFIDTLPNDFRGNIMYWLSMRYVDLCIEKMYKWFKENDLLKSTLFLITADHGSSFGFHPIRNSLVNNEHDENYHIPCVFFGEDVSPYEDNRYFSTKDMVKTLLEYSDIHDDVFSGSSVLNVEYDCDYAITEYLGGGCPDISRKPIEFIIRDDRYSIGLKQYVTREFSQNNIYCVYDRGNDPNETVNIKDSVNMDDIRYLLKKLELRFEMIQNDVESDNQL